MRAHTHTPTWTVSRIRVGKKPYPIIYYTSGYRICLAHWALKVHYLSSRSRRTSALLDPFLFVSDVALRTSLFLSSEKIVYTVFVVSRFVSEVKAEVFLGPRRLKPSWQGYWLGTAERGTSCSSQLSAKSPRATRGVTGSERAAPRTGVYGHFRALG